MDKGLDSDLDQGLTTSRNQKKPAHIKSDWFVSSYYLSSIQLVNNAFDLRYAASQLVVSDLVVLLRIEALQWTKYGGGEVRGRRVVKCDWDWVAGTDTCIQHYV